MSFVADEIASQPDCWGTAADLARDPSVAAALPDAGERVAVVGCGTSLFMAQSSRHCASRAGHGETDAFPASEFPAGRHYDRVVALTRSGTTTEIVDCAGLARWPGPPTVITDRSATTRSAAVGRRRRALDFADERSVVQTRFATTALALWRAYLGAELSAAIADAAAVVASDASTATWTQRAQFTFLGTGWTVGLASEAALKLRESAQAWTEAYPAMEFRHGPISVVDGAPWSGSSAHRRRG